MNNRSPVRSTYHCVKQVKFGERVQYDIAECGAEKSSIARVISSGIFHELLSQHPHNCYEVCAWSLLKNILNLKNDKL